MTAKDRADNLLDFNSKEKALEIIEADIKFFDEVRTTNYLRVIGYLQSVKQELLNKKATQ